MKKATFILVLLCLVAFTAIAHAEKNEKVEASFGLGIAFDKLGPPIEIKIVNSDYNGLQAGCDISIFSHFSVMTRTWRRPKEDYILGIAVSPRFNLPKFNFWGTKNQFRVKPIIGYGYQFGTEKLRAEFGLDIFLNLIDW